MANPSPVNKGFFRPACGKAGGGDLHVQNLSQREVAVFCGGWVKEQRIPHHFGATGFFRI
jgi:hypothetical protein